MRTTSININKVNNKIIIRIKTNNGGVGSGIKGHITQDEEKNIVVKGNEFGEYKDIKELRQKAREYYRENLQGRYVENSKLGKILFSRTGLEKFLSSGSQEDKVKSIIAIPYIIKYGEYKGEEKLLHPRQDGIIKFHRINKLVSICDKKKLMSVLIAEDINGNRFYNLNNNTEKDFEFLPQSNEGSSKSSNIIINKANLKVNPLNKRI